MRGPLVIVGDVLLDRDVVGRAERLSPDGPGPVVETESVTVRPGGAGLAALLAGLYSNDQFSTDVVLIAPIAEDAAGTQVRRMLEYDVDLIPLPGAGTTPEKSRIRCAGHSLLRLDTGGPLVPGGPLPARAVEALRSAEAVLVSDYGSGALSHASLRVALQRAARRVPLVWDPHPRSGPPVEGARLVTPNDSEAAKLAGPIALAAGLALVEVQAEMLCRRWRCDAVAITRGERGTLLSYGEGAPLLVPVEEHPGSDTCGAGDAFAVAAARLLREGAGVADAVLGAARAASDYVAAGGVAQLASNPDRRAHRSTFGRTEPDQAVALAERVRARGGTVVATGGCFDLLHAGHVELLRQARRLGDCLIVLLNSDESVARLKGSSRPVVPAADRIAVLEGLASVDAVITFAEDTPVETLRRVRPHLWVKGADYTGVRLPEADALAEWDGRLVLLPSLPGRSTTGLIKKAAGRAGRLVHQRRMDNHASGDRRFELAEEGNR